jgi:hypothetical protein
VGTSSPGTKLEVAGSAAFRTDADVRLTLGSSGSIGSNNSNFIRAATDQVIYNAATSSGRHSWELAGSEKARIDSSGRLGIGTSSPSSYSTYADDLVISNGFAGITLASATSGYGSIYFADGTAGTDVQRGAIQYSHADDYLRFSTAVNERMRIDSSGRVGIGTTSPTQALEVAGSIRLNNDLLYADATATRGRVYGDSTGLVVRADTGLALRFHADAGEKARIDTSGRLLVGTSSSRTTTNTPQILVESVNTTTGDRGITVVGGGASNVSPLINFAKHRSASIGGTTAVSDGDFTGAIVFNGSDGTNFIQSAFIAAAIDGTPGANDMPGRLVFSTTADGASSPTERMRITNGGTVGIGVTPSAWVSTRQVIQVGRAAAACDTAVSNGGSSIASNNFYYDGSDRAIATGYSQGIVFNPTGAGTTQVVSTSGTNTGGNAITFTGGPFVAAGGTSWTSSSDERLKNIIEPITDGLEKVAEIRAVKFSWKDDPDERVNVGVIAQDVEAVLPEIVSKSQKYGSDDQTEYLGVSYDLLAPLLIAALQEAKTKIETLEAKVVALESA